MGYNESELTVTWKHEQKKPRVAAAEVERRMNFADAALGAAGHEVTDPTLRELTRQVADGTLAAAEAIARGVALIDAAEVERRLSFADAALGAAGHEVTDPVVLAIRRRLAAEEITGDEAAALTKEHLLGPLRSQQAK